MRQFLLFLWDVLNLSRLGLLAHYRRRRRIVDVPEFARPDFVPGDGGFSRESASTPFALELLNPEMFGGDVIAESASIRIPLVTLLTGKAFLV